MTNQAIICDHRIGIGLRSPHIQDLLCTQPNIGWVEVHSENWMCDQGPIAERLQEICEKYPLSLHGVGLSLGSADGLNHHHLSKLTKLIERTQPILISEHLSWGSISGKHSNDLLPLPFNQQAIELLVKHIDQVQQVIGRTILIENISSYCSFNESTMPEWEFIQNIVEKANCGLLLDINNVYVNAQNHGFSAQEYLSNIPWAKVAEIHLAGFEEEGTILVDTHGRPIQEPVWDLYIESLRNLPSSARTLIEWDSNLPPL